MPVGHGLAQRDDLVHMGKLVFQQRRLSPWLRRSPERHRASEALPPVAQLAIVPPEDVVLADEPVVMDRVELDPISQCEDAGPADQRDVVEMNDVEALGQDRLDRRALDDRPSRLVREERRSERPAALQLVNGHTGGLHDGRGSGRRAKGAVADPPRIGVVDHFDFASAPGQRVHEVADVIAVTAEVARRIEGRHDGDPKRASVLGAVIIHSIAPGDVSVSRELPVAGKSASRPGETAP